MRDRKTGALRFLCSECPARSRPLRHVRNARATDSDSPICSEKACPSEPLPANGNITVWKKGVDFFNFGKQLHQTGGFVNPDSAHNLFAIIHRKGDSLWLK